MCIDRLLDRQHLAEVLLQHRRELIGPRCVAPQAVAAPPGDDWIGCGNGFAVYGNFGLKIVLSMVRPTALAVAQLAAPHLAAGEGVDAALAAPRYVRDKVAFTREELGHS